MSGAVNSGASTDAETFLRMLGGRHTFQTFDDTSAKQARLSRVLHGELLQHASTLRGLNDRGAGVFVMVNAGDGLGRRNENVVAVRALFVDLDGAPLDPVARAELPPSCIVETSPNRWHAYWRVRDCEIQEFKVLQRMLANRFQGDPKVCDLARVMRLPGFAHRKRQAFRSRIVACSLHPPYTMEDFRSAFSTSANERLAQLDASTAIPAKIGEGARNSTLFRLGRWLANGGQDANGVKLRLERVNAQCCQPPLCPSELAGVAASASKHVSSGFAALPHALLDSPAWKALRPTAHTIIVRAFRRYNGHNNGRIALPFSDFKGLPGFSNSSCYYAHRTSAIASGIIVRVYEGRQTRDGKEADLFAIAEQYLRRPSSQAAENALCA